MSAIVENCGYVLYFVNEVTPSATNNDPAKTIFCAACQAGYRPIFTDGKISECVLIENCKTSFKNEFFNICPECAEGF